MPDRSTSLVSVVLADMASEVISLILPALPRGQGFTSSQRAQASAVQEMDVSDALKLWVGLAPSPVSRSRPISLVVRSSPGRLTVSAACLCSSQLVALIVTVILLERMSARFPELGGLGGLDPPPG